VIIGFHGLLFQFAVLSNPEMIPLNFGKKGLQALNADLPLEWEFICN